MAREETVFSDSTNSLAELDAQVLLNSVLWYEKFYNLYASDAELLASFKNLQQVESEKSPHNPEDTEQPAVSFNPEKLTFVIFQDFFKQEFWQSSDGEFLKNVISKGLELRLSDLNILGHLELQKLLNSEAHLLCNKNSKLIIFGYDAFNSLLANEFLKHLANDYFKWQDTSIGTVNFVPEIGLIAGMTNYKKEFWNILKPLKKKR